MALLSSQVNIIISSLHSHCTNKKHKIYRELLDIFNIIYLFILFSVIVYLLMLVFMDVFNYICTNILI